MGLFEDVNRFLEDKLDDFLKSNPLLEAKALLEQIKEQEKDNLKLVIQLENEAKQIQREILALAQDIQLWHSRVKKAQSLGEKELAQKAQARENELLHQGNVLWGKMEGRKQQITQAKALLKQIEAKKVEVQAKIRTLEVNAHQSQSSSNWGDYTYTTRNAGSDPLEQRFREWETEQELENMKRNLQ